jgi:hypothetical protein
MNIDNEIVLRPRFKRNLPYSMEQSLEQFKTLSGQDQRFKTSIVGYHVFIRIPKSDQHFWSPQLHLELRDEPSKGTTIHGLFGPSPTLWTFFMFLHFVAAGLFIAAGIWCYTKTVLDESIMAPVITMAGLIILWVSMYLAGRAGKKKGEPQMYQLYYYMRDCFGIEKFTR